MLPAPDDLSSLEAALVGLITTPSVNPAYDPESVGEIGVLRRVAEMAENAGLDVEYQEALPERPNLIIGVAPQDGKDRASQTILIEVHADTVALRSGESVPGVEVRDGWVYGRGACDVKGSLVAALAAVHHLNQARTLKHSNVRLLCAVDEEYLFRGILSYLDSNPVPDYAIVCEPTELNIVYSHSGVLRFEIAFHGEEAHSSQIGEGKNAIRAAVKAVTSLEEWYATNYPGDEHGMSALTVTIIRGGSAINITPGTCTIAVDVRVHPNISADKVFREIKTFVSSLELNGVRAEVSQPSVADNGMPYRENAVLPEIGHRVAPKGSEVITVAFGTDASKLQRRGADCIVFGPGSIRDAHSDNERVHLEDVRVAAQTMVRIIEELDSQSMEAK